MLATALALTNRSAALFESEISKSGGNNGRGTLPLKRPISRPPLKQSFSSLNVGRSSFTKTSVPPLNATAKLSANSAEELGAAVTPPPAENRGKSLARPRTPKKPELPGLAIIKEPEGKTPATKTVDDCGEDADDSVFENGSLSLPHEEDDIAHEALQDNVLAQQTVISQATQALNLCQASAEFLGSAEQVEGEKLLLIATQKRLAYLNEIQRLKVGGDNPASELPRGSLMIKKIRFPINKDALKSSSGFVYHFLCMVQYRGKVHASQLISSDTMRSSEENCLEFDNEIEYSSMDEDFQVQIDLYGLKTISPVVPHDKKYHIKKETIKMKLSSRGRKTDSIFMTPGISSPGGPNAVRTSSFQSLGSFVLTTSNCHQSVFALSKVPGSFCIEGKAFVELQLHADHGLEHHGFLPPIDTIDLRQCITKEVSRLPRTECARAHTFELVIVEPLGSRHRDTLTTTRHATVAITRHRLSADSKDDLIVWCTAFNRVLSCIRKWDPEAYKAMDVKQFV
ncbi:hypothetical protein HPB52_017959 [Rhipicephalus sanguineus]|uniref:Anillin homology domain-containing protein n=1 Tax=Rhipicephalus sanguineus TaxID=34632 RepID=A0A9D4SZX9_RHISA|nr:hypothetical protein HPB52_017959 [Rhipicephalus sanguineus]